MTSEDVAKRIKNVAKIRNVSVKTLLEDCHLSKGTITNMNNGSNILCNNLVKIADYLDCSTDYLLCRTNIIYTNKNASQ